MGESFIGRMISYKNRTIEAVNSPHTSHGGSSSTSTLLTVYIALTVEDKEDPKTGQREQ